MQRLPSTWTAETKPVCNDSAAAPALDATAGVVLGAITWLAASIDATFDCGFNSGASECEDDDGGKALALGALVAAPFLVSATYGFSQSSRCAAASRAHHDFIARQTMPPQPGPAAAAGPAQVASPPGLVAPMDSECRASVEAYQAESDPGRQAILYRDMPESCRERIGRTVTEEEWNLEIAPTR